MTNLTELSGLQIERHQHRIAPGRRWVGRYWVLLLIVVLAAFFCANFILERPEVTVKPAVRASLSEDGAWGELNATGYIVADRQSTVAAKYTARLARLNVREAAEVKEGDVLAELDHRELDAMIGEAEADVSRTAAAIHQAEAGVANADAQLAQANQGVVQSDLEILAAEAAVRGSDAQIDELRIALEDAVRRQGIDGKLLKARLIEANSADDRQTEVGLNKARLIAAQQKKLETEKSVPVAKARAAAARNGVQVAEAQIKAAQAGLETAQAVNQASLARVKTLNAQREDYFVKAPFDGVISERIAEQGEIVAPVSIGGTQAKGAIVTVVDRASLQAEVDAAEGFLERVKVGGRVRLTVDAFPKECFPGTVQRILPMVDRGKATVKVRVDFRKIDPRFLPDMGVRGKFLRPDAPPGAEDGLASDPLLVPVNAVIQLNGQSMVWCTQSERVKRFTVKTGARHGELIEILEGLSDGAIVVVQGASQLSRDDQNVRVNSERAAR
ncbi:MAG: efflux RND transporter periplasmic adaptor subunit [Candidatus Riflebacteria bacterium]|nr:efflux RND transporter periplasmic adaptor subunit [Candidatus Riflebacteria bacterium]